MGLRFIVGAYDGDESRECAVMVDSTSGWAFGPVFDSYDDAEAFSEWFSSGRAAGAARDLALPVPQSSTDARAYSDAALKDLHIAWKEQLTNA